MVFRYRALVQNPAGVLDRICAFVGVPAGVLTELPRENVTAHPHLTARHRALSRALRIGATASAILPGRTEAAGTSLLERQCSRTPGRSTTSRVILPLRLAAAPPAARPAGGRVIAGTRFCPAAESGGLPHARCVGLRC